MSVLEFLLQRWQAFVFLPVIETGSRLAAVEPGCLFAEVSESIGLKFVMQQLSKDVSHLLERETGCCFFPPGVFLESGTTWQSR